MHTSFIQNWGFEALVALDWTNSGLGFWGSYNGPNSWEVMNERSFGLKNVE